MRLLFVPFLIAALAAPAAAALPVGSKAPDFVTTGPLPA